MTPLALAGACGLLGLLVGSFLNVVIARVPAGESVVHPGSRCPSCGQPVRARDNVPVLSWLLLRGRCRDCRARIPGRYPLVELLTAGVFVAVAVRFGPSAALPAFLYLAAISVALTFIDLDVHRLPDAIVLPSYVVSGLLLAVPALTGASWGAYGRAWAGAAILYGAYFALAFAYPAGMGFGDVKLAGVLGLHLGWLGWGHLAVGAFLAFLAGGLVGLALIALGRATRKSAIPFGPFMLLGALVAVELGDPILALYLGGMSGGMSG